MKTVLTIAGSDSSGGAGIQADLKTMTAHGLYGMSVITALTAQNTTGVFGIFESTPEFVGKQLDAVFTDIFPDSVKIGMVSNPEIVKVIAQRLELYKAKNIVLDPVMVSTSGSKLMSDDAQNVLVSELLPLARVITPNVPECEILAGIKIQTSNDMVEAGKIIFNKTKVSVLVKGGHRVNDANDVLINAEGAKWFFGERIDNPNTHGTGCTLSSAIACGLAKGKTLSESVISAKAYISKAIKDGMDLGKGSGPLNHCCIINKPSVDK
ncbi:MAG: bifunctional hydroxymethylpyrimidine kinase/phosphomethylpyrimidine kinase [Clostridiales bacterium]|nr:bifunctional hydroxymethylpyrimidine kinase/phosphomethylpyrimidine kinase [Clostridiales bacterium]